MLFMSHYPAHGKRGWTAGFLSLTRNSIEGNRKKVRVSGSSIKLTGIRKQANGWGLNALQGSETWHFEKGIKQQSLVDTHWCTLNLNWSDTKNARFDGFFFFLVFCFFNAGFGLQCTVCFRLVTRSKHGSSYRGYNYIELIWRETKMNSS